MAIFRRKGVDRAFLARIALTPHRSKWLPSIAALLAAGMDEVPGRPDGGWRR